MHERGALVLLPVLLATAGCTSANQLLAGNPGASGPASLEDLPGMGSLDLSNARLAIEATGCREANLLVPANATRVRERLPANRSLGHLDGDETRLALVFVRCQTLTFENTTRGPVTLLDVSVPLEGARDSPRRTDRVLWMMADDDAVVDRLQRTGLPAEHAPDLAVEALQRHRIAEQLRLEVHQPDVDLAATATAVSIETELPFGTTSTIGRDRVVPTPNGSSLQIQQGLNATDVGGIAGTLELRPHSPLANLLGNTTRSAYGYRSHYDARVGVLATTT